MVDAIDVFLAKKLSTQGSVETLAKEAREAVEQAEEIINNISNITE